MKNQATPMARWIVLGVGALVLGMSMMATVRVAIVSSSNYKMAQAPRDSSHYEEWLKKEVRHQLVMLPWYSVFDDLEYSVNDGTVTLEGQVVRAVIKSDAENAVKKLEGVEKVVNNIEVLPPSPNDDRIRRATFRAIYSFPSFSATPSRRCRRSTSS